VSSAVIILCVASRRVFIVVCFVIYSVRKLLDTPSYVTHIHLVVTVTVRTLSKKIRVA
jgi:arginine exporter protein ArgO